jgi:hypothetical protein
VARSTSWFSAEVREKVKAAVKDVERVTSAELVVAVQPSSGHYRHTDPPRRAVGPRTLCLFLYHPGRSMVLAAQLAGYSIRRAVVGFVWCSAPLTSRRLSATNEIAARAIRRAGGKTRDRSGVLVLVSASNGAPA